MDTSNLTKEQLAGVIDHTLLLATATTEQIERLCDEAIEHGFCCVSVNSRWVPLVADRLHNSKVKTGGVVSLPLGADSTKIKIAQAKEIIFTGADEVDMVADLAAIIEGDSRYLQSQMNAMVKICRSVRPSVTLKVIIESAALTFEQIMFASAIIKSSGADFIKTSTGMHPAGGAKVEDIQTIKDAAPGCKIKAAGGIRTAEQAIKMLAAGADRIGTTASVAIIKEFQPESA